MMFNLLLSQHGSANDGKLKKQWSDLLAAPFTSLIRGKTVENTRWKQSVLFLLLLFSLLFPPIHSTELLGNFAQAQFRGTKCTSAFSSFAVGSLHKQPDKFTVYLFFQSMYINYTHVIYRKNYSDQLLLGFYYHLKPNF